MNRPIIGYANFCPYSLNNDVTDDFIIAVAKHEILHALVSQTKTFNPIVMYNDRDSHMDNMHFGEMRMVSQEQQETVMECLLRVAMGMTVVLFS